MAFGRDPVPGCGTAAALLVSGLEVVTFGQGGWLGSTDHPGPPNARDRGAVKA